MVRSLAGWAIAAVIATVATYLAVGAAFGSDGRLPAWARR